MEPSSRRRILASRTSVVEQIAGYHRPACHDELMDGDEVSLEVSKELRTSARLVSATRVLSRSSDKARFHLWHAALRRSYARSYKHGLRRPLRAGVALVKGTDSECSLADQPGLDRPKAIRSRSDGDSQSMIEHADAQPTRIDS